MEIFLRIRIFDTGADRGLHSITIFSYTMSMGLIAVYNICDAESFGMLIVNILLT